MLNNNKIGGIYILTTRLFINDPTGLYTCLHFDQAGLATFNSFVNARYSDISVDCNDFDAGFLIPYRNI